LSKILVKIQMGSPSTGAPNKCGVGKICDFRQIIRYISRKRYK